MKNKVISSIILIIIFLLFSVYVCEKSKIKPHKIIQIVRPDLFYIDLNDDGIPDNNELFKLKDVYAYDTTLNDFTREQAKKLEIDEYDYLKDGFLARNWAQNVLLDKEVYITSKTDTYNYDSNMKYRYVNVSFDGKDLGKFYLENGLGYLKDDTEDADYLAIENINKSKLNAKVLSKLDFVLVNLHSKIFHELNCEYSPLIKNAIIELRKNAIQVYKSCNICANSANKIDLKLNSLIPLSKNKYLKSVNKNFGAIELYLINPLEYSKPDSNCKSAICKRILSEINSSNKTIDIALYGFGEIKAIVDALNKARARGVKIRFVADYSKNMDKIYPYTSKLIADFSGHCDKSDIIMHNKFFIFDNQKVITGSANISPSGIGGYSANTVLLINSASVARSYLEEFEQMYQGYFSKKKKEIPIKEFILNDSKVTVYFLPKNDAYNNLILKEIKNAKSEIIVSAFYLTDKVIVQELISAKKRGVNVFILMDALGAINFKDKIFEMRKNLIPVIVENWGGKNHEKTMVIDKNDIIMGSANFTKSGFFKNDENILLIKNPKIAEFYRDYYFYLFNSIDKKFLKRIPRAESLESINSCYDGVDNNFDGKIDSEDDGCK